MTNIQQLVEWDKEMLLAINGCHNLFWDGFMWVVTDTKTWIPVAALLLYVIFKNNKLVPHTFFSDNIFCNVSTTVL